MFKAQTVQILRVLVKLFLCLLLSIGHFTYAAGSDIDNDGFQDDADLCPFYYNLDQRFHGVVGCQDTDSDGFEDMFWDACPGVFGRNVGCPEDRHYSLITSLELPQIKLADACYITDHTVTDGDILMIEVDGKNAKPLFSYPIKVE